MNCELHGPSPDSGFCRLCESQGGLSPYLVDGLTKYITKRQLFAAIAMHGLLASGEKEDLDDFEDSKEKTIASMAVDMADALMSKLAK